jgi:hypothetical protein
MSISFTALVAVVVTCSNYLVVTLCDKTRTFSHSFKHDELRLILHHRYFHTYETSAQRLFHYCQIQRYSHGVNA